MCVYMYTYMTVYMCMRVHIHTCVPVYVYMCVHAHMCIDEVILMLKFKTILEKCVHVARCKRHSNAAIT